MLYHVLFCPKSDILAINLFAILIFWQPEKSVIDMDDGSFTMT